mmetsp:Transcript_8828/g.14674  ORF Transcript_8828/g.14674 Transcript_8828/m.14674 type:complete len:338 (+) Transcript_8828:22-1035(+)
MSGATEMLVSSPVSTGLLSSLTDNTHVVGAAWMISSALFTTYSTTRFLKYDTVSTSAVVDPKSRAARLLSTMPRPTLLTLCRFGGSLLLGLLAHPNANVMQRIRDTKKVLPDFALPATFLFIANYANSISLNRIGISLTYTTKCGIPLMTVLLTLLLDGTKAMPSLLTLASLVPIALGIAAASWNSPTFERTGFAAALLSCTAQSALNVSSKRAMSKTGLAGPPAQRAMVAVGFVIAVVFSFLQPKPTEKTKFTRTDPPPWLVGMAISAYHVEYVLSFMFVKLVSPITYGACDAIRRLSIILSGHWMFGGSPFSRLNILGIALALLGALSYSITSNI